VNECLDLAVDDLLNEMSWKVMLAADDGADRKTYSPLTEEEISAYNILKKASNNFHRSSFVSQSMKTLNSVVPPDTFDVTTEVNLGSSTLSPTQAVDSEPVRPAGEGTAPPASPTMGGSSTIAHYPSASDFDLLPGDGGGSSAAPL